MEILEALDLTATAWSAAQLAGCDANAVAQDAAIRDAGGQSRDAFAQVRP